MVVTLSAESDRCKCCGSCPSRRSSSGCAPRTRGRSSSPGPGVPGTSPWQRRWVWCCGGCGRGDGHGAASVQRCRSLVGPLASLAGSLGPLEGSLSRETRIECSRPLQDARRPLRHGPDRLQHKAHTLLGIVKMKHLCSKHHEKFEEVSSG